MFTRSSVHWADRIVAISSCSGIIVLQGAADVRVGAVQRSDDLCGVTLLGSRRGHGSFRKIFRLMVTERTGDGD